MTVPGVGHALGLGRAVGEPVLGESLQLEVSLTGTIDQPLDNDCVTIRRPPDSIDADYFPRDLIARVEKLGGASRLLLSTRSALRQPLVEFRISITCGYNLSHDYLLMASPRVERAQTVSTAPAASGATATTGSVASSTPTSTTNRARQAPEVPVIFAPAAAATAGTAMPDGLPGKSFTPDREMTLEQVARQFFPGPLRQERFMRWVAEANPQAFAGVANLRQHRLAAGHQLTIPDGVPPRRPGDYKNGISPLGEPIATAPTDAAAAAPTRKEKPATAAVAAEPQPGKAIGDGRRDLLVVGSGAGTARDLKEAVALVDRLTGMMQEQLSAQTANDEKIQKLESTMTELGKYLVKLESDVRQREAAVQTELQAVKNAREHETERGWWQLLLAVVVGGLAGVAALKAYGLVAARRHGAGDALAAFPLDPPPEVAADVASGPLTERGRDAEPSGEASRQTRAARTSVPEPSATNDGSGPAAALAALSQQMSVMEKRTESTTPVVPIDFEPPGFGQSEQEAKPASESVATMTSHEPSDPATAAIELANIMTSMGLAESAAQTLVEHIRGNPRQSLQHWLKLLELHRLNGNRAEFERSANEMREYFNVQADEWAQSISLPGRGSLDTYPHLRTEIIRLWRKPDCLPFLQTLLIDNREGTRVGFPLPVAEEILLLVAILSSSEP